MATRIPLKVLNPEFKDSSNNEASSEAKPSVDAASLRTRAQGGDIQEEIQKEVNENPILLYMKGTPNAPACGFSARVVQILSHVGLPEYAAVNILIDPEKRQGIKDFSDWPTIPQLYVNGEFVGGCDIITEMFQANELPELFGLE